MDVLEHFQQKMMPTISSLQARSDIYQGNISEEPLPPVQSLDEFGKEVVQCCEGTALYKVKTSVCNYSYSYTASNHVLVYIHQTMLMYAATLDNKYVVPILSDL